MSACIDVALCADDYALHAGIDDAICALLAARRLSAVSCLSTAPRWAMHAAPRLRELHASAPWADIGLHLNLTEGFGEPAPSLASVIMRSYARQFSRDAVRTAMARQFDAFESAMEGPPAFVDGHQHIHQLPQLRDCLLDLLACRYRQQLPWVRTTVPASAGCGAKARVLAMLGGNALERKLRQRGVASNDGFAGVYGFDKADYAQAFGRWLGMARTLTLLVCHPSAAPGRNDPIGAQRMVEYAFFGSDAFLPMLAAHNIRLAPLSTLLPRA